MPWHIPADLKFFKTTTLGKPVVMGRKTFGSIGRPLPGRLNIIMTRDPGFHPAGVDVAADVDAAISLAATAAGAGEIMVIGGAQIYAEVLPSAQRLYLTEVHASVAGDTRFPHLEPSQWIERSRERCRQDIPTPLEFSFVVLERAG